VAINYLTDIELDAIAQALAQQTWPGYPTPSERLFWNTPGLILKQDTLHVPDGPWHIDGHPNRQGVASSLLDQEVLPGMSARQAISTKDWHAESLDTDQYNRPLHPHWQQLLRHPGIGLPTGLGAFYRYGPNSMVDSVVYRLSPEKTWEFLLIQKANGKWGLPGGFVEPDDHSPASAARRELGEETGLVDLKGTIEPLVHLLPIRQRDTLNAWAEVQVFLVHAEPAYVAQATPLPGDDAIASGWFSENVLSTLPMFDTHTVYIRKALARLKQPPSLRLQRTKPAE
jgi:ADP-ribose pyrophosphatase YjhB (NUDIX family)